MMWWWCLLCFMCVFGKRIIDRTTSDIYMTKGGQPYSDRWILDLCAYCIRNHKKPSAHILKTKISGVHRKKKKTHRMLRIYQIYWNRHFSLWFITMTFKINSPHPSHNVWKRSKSSVIKKETFIKINIRTKTFHLYVSLFLLYR